MPGITIPLSHPYGRRPHDPNFHTPTPGPSPAYMPQLYHSYHIYSQAHKHSKHQVFKCALTKRTVNPNMHACQYYTHA